MAGIKLREELAEALRGGLVIPAHPLALTDDGRLDRASQYALTRYYIAAGAGGVAVGVHNTQLGIHYNGMYEDVLRIAVEAYEDAKPKRPFLMLAGVLLEDEGRAVGEAQLAADLGYDMAVPVPLGAVKDEGALLSLIQRISEILPIFAFYPQRAIGGPALSRAFWAKLAEEMPNLYAVKIAPFNRYETIYVVRAIASIRDDVAFYTGNDDNIIIDLLTPIPVGGKYKWIVGGLLGQWSVWTLFAVKLLDKIKEVRRKIAAGAPIPSDLLRLNAEYTDANSAIFDAAHGFKGLYAGINEVLRRQGLVKSRRTLDGVDLSPGQLEEIERVLREYPHLHEEDDAFVKEHLGEFLSGYTP
jgi:hypothetical protein|nr:MAG: hypothetical protein TU35_03660 [Thermoproteus sp. AZ2]